MRSLFLGALLFAAATPAAPQDLVLTNAQIVDPQSRTVTEGSLWIRDGRIAGVGPQAPEDAPGERIDAAGRWIIPGLVDLHTHSFGNSAPGGVSDGGGTEETAQRVLRAGVTAFLDLFGAEEYLFSLRDRQRRGEVGGAAIFAAGPCFTATAGHCSEYGIPTRLIDSPQDARREVADLAPKRPDVIKVVYDHFDYGPGSMPSLDRPTLEALVQAGREAGLKTIVHVGTWSDVRDAVLAGAAAVTHVPGDGEPPPDLPALMAERGVAHIPTLAVHTDLAALLADPALLGSPLLEAVTSEALREAYGRGMEGLEERARSWVARQREGAPARLEAMRRVHAAGVPMLAGTDAGNWGVIQGYSVHRELLRLVEAGLTTWEALAAATTSPGDFLGRDFGVGPGDEANLVLLGGSPLDDIANTQRIDLVVMRGRVVHRR